MSTYNALKYNVPFASAGGLIALSTQTASADASLSFTSGIDSTYSEYLFLFNNIHPATDQVNFQVGFRDGASAFDATKTTTLFLANHDEANSYTTFAYSTDLDLAQSTAYQNLTENTGGDADQSCSGYLHLFDPSDTTFVKHFIGNVHNCRHSDAAESYYTAGYANVTAAIDGVDFKMSSGNIDAGTIQMFGVVK